jgi:pyruvate dehydrogenase complex dehydrogenase (E1) component
LNKSQGDNFNLAFILREVVVMQVKTEIVKTYIVTLTEMEMYYLRNITQNYVGPDVEGGIEQEIREGIFKAAKEAVERG